MEGCSGGHGVALQLERGHDLKIMTSRDNHQGSSSSSSGGASSAAGRRGYETTMMGETVKRRTDATSKFIDRV